MMTPREIHDAWVTVLTSGDHTQFDKVCDQLWTRDLIMETTPEGYLIRQRRASDDIDKPRRPPRPG